MNFGFKKINQYFSSGKNLFGLSLFGFTSSLFVVSYYSWYHITHPVVPFYDMDGWGHLVTKMIENGKTWSLLQDCVYLWRGFLVPFIFGLSYCIFRIPESVQILNVILQALCAGILTYWLGKRHEMPLIGLLIGIIWAAWPPFAQGYGYYYSEYVCGITYLLIWIVITEFLDKPQRYKAILAGAILASSLHVRPASVVMVLFILFYISFVLYKNYGKLVLLVIFSFLIIYLPWPIRNYISEHHFIPFTTQGGFVLHQGTYLPGDGMAICYLRTLPEYQRIESKSKGMSLAERDHYFRGLALAQIKANPIGQLKLVAKKMLRFWYYIQPHKWLPTPRTLLVMTPLILLAIVGTINRMQENVVVQVAAIMVAGLWLLHGILHAELRYHFPIFPMLLFLSFWGVSAITDFFKKTKNRS